MGAVEKVGKSKVRMTFEVSPERFQEGLRYSYNKNKARVEITGFRKGKAPRRVIENVYGKNFFYEDAIEHVLHDAYVKALDENGIEPVYKPDLHLEEANESTGVVFTAEIYVKPVVTVDGYYGLTYPIPDIEPNDGEIQAHIERERSKNARSVSVERPVESGDIVVINYTGYIDGEPFEGGKASGHQLTVGSRQFIDTFEDQLIGANIGDDLEVNVTFPENYPAESLSGKPALFKVEILDIMVREMPELNDEFAQDISEFDTLEDYRQDLYEKIRVEKERQADTVKRNYVMRQLIAKAEMEVPEIMYTTRADEMMENFSQRLSQQGITLQKYLEYSGMSEELLRKQQAEQAKLDVDSLLVTDAVAAKEGFSISNEEYEAYITKIAENSKMDPKELLGKVAPERRKEIEKEILRIKTFNFVLDKAVAADQPYTEPIRLPETRIGESDGFLADIVGDESEDE